MRRVDWLGMACVVVLAGCSVELGLDETVVLSCQVDSDCPPGLQCQEALGRCISEEISQDTDQDGVPDAFDVCPQGDDLTDRDQDTVPDACDQCLNGDDRVDSDGDTVPDACDLCEGADDAVDADSDGFPDPCDVCPGGNDALDLDGDGIPRDCDLCTSGDDALDADSDGVPDACDACAAFDDFMDDDADGVPDLCDVCPGGSDRADADGDGVPDLCDRCAGVDDNNPPNPNDDPEPLAGGTFSDTNCDTIDGNASIAYFVTPNGDDTDDGSLTAPFKTIQHAIDEAVANGRSHVYVEGGFYSERLTLADGVSIFGGYSFGFTVRNPAAVAVVVSPDPITMSADATGWTQTIVVEGLRLLSQPAATAGGSSRAAVVQNLASPASLVFRSMGFSPGPGAPGTDGFEGAPGLPGAHGGDGTVPDGGTPLTDPLPSAWCDVLGGDGAAGKFLSIPNCSITRQGVAGFPGSAGDTSSTPGSQGNGGQIDLFDFAPGQGGDATGDGDDGANSSQAAAATQQAGVVSGDDWTAGAGSNDATDGLRGSGGGGGGSGASAFADGCPAIGGGGAGGGGGCGGIAGTPGGGGGGSLGVLLVSSPEVTFEDCQFVTQAGGDGGEGGDGGPGGAGGNPGSGGTAGCEVGMPNESFSCSADGGAGSNGGDGGAAQGGGGGASVGVLCVGGSAPCVQAESGSAANSFDIGNAGSAGLPGTTPGASIAPLAAAGVAAPTFAP